MAVGAGCERCAIRRTLRVGYNRRFRSRERPWFRRTWFRGPRFRGKWFRGKWFRGRFPGETSGGRGCDMEGRIMFSACLRVWMVAAMVLVVAPGARAHPLHVSRAQLSIADDGQGDRRFTLTVTTDLVALMLRTAPGHIPDSLRADFEAMSDADIAAEYGPLRQALAAESAVRFDGAPAGFDDRAFASIDSIRKTLATHLYPKNEATFAGRVPAGARPVSVSLPAMLALVQLNVRIEGRDVATQLLRDGQASWPIALQAGDVNDAGDAHDAPARPSTNASDEADAAEPDSTTPEAANDATPAASSEDDSSEEAITSAPPRSTRRATTTHRRHHKTTHQLTQTQAPPRGNRFTSRR